MTGVESGLVHLVPLTGTELPMVEHEGQPWVIFTRAVEALGLNAEAQRRRVQRQPWARIETASAIAADGKLRPQKICTVQTFVMWAATMEVSRVTSMRAREALIAYQCETADAVTAYWTKGIAVNTRGRTPEQVAMIEAAASGLAGDVLSATYAAHTCLQYLDGRRDMPEGEDKASVTRKLHGHVRRAHKAAVASGLDAAYALSSGSTNRTPAG